MSIIAALFILLFGMLPVIFCRENPKNSEHEKINFLRAMKMILSNGPYMILVGGFFIVLTSCSISSGISGLINLYYVCRGDQELNGTLFNWIVISSCVLSFASLFLLSGVSRSFGKKAGFITGENICIDGGQTKLMIYHGDNGWTLTE